MQNKGFKYISIDSKVAAQIGQAHKLTRMAAVLAEIPPLFSYEEAQVSINSVYF